MNEEIFGSDNFWLVCYSCGSFLEDQSAENVARFENKVNNLDPEIFKNDLESIKNEQDYLTTTLGIVVDMNEEYYENNGY